MNLNKNLFLIFLTIIAVNIDRRSCSQSLSPQRHYLKYNQTIEFINELHEKYRNLVEISSIGKSAQNRDLFVIKISNDLNDRQVLKPMFKYVANIHGNEALGHQLMLVLAQYLCDNYGKDQRVTRIVNTTEVHLLPNLNADGFEAAKEGDCFGAERQTGRQNANNVDLNRDFPDQFEPEANGDLSRRQPETLAVMTWIVSNPFVLSAALHGGSVVASYPFDDSRKHTISGHKSPTPDNALFEHLALTYASNHKTMKNGSVCLDDSFRDGITNGAEWYDVPGGMQDFNYVNSNCFEITLELSCCKYPKESELEKEWNNNKESLLSYIEMVQMGVKGIVRDALTHNAIEGATVLIEGIRHNITTTNRGEYWRLALPGVYSITARAVGYESETKKEVVIKNTAGASAQILNFDLKPIGNIRFPSVNSPDTTGAIEVLNNHKKIKSKTNDSGIEREDWAISVHNMSESNDFQSEPEFKHHNYTELKAFLQNLNQKYPHLTRLYSIGKSIEGRDLWVLEISDKPGVHEPGEPEFKYVANMHGNEVIGRELVLLLAKHLLENYGQNQSLTKLMRSTRIHLMPTMNPDGYERSLLGDCNSEYGRGNAHKVDLNRNFPDQYMTYKENRVQEKETIAAMEWIRSYPFVLSANLHGGSLVANYPFDGNSQQKDGIYSKTPDDVLFRHLALVYSLNHATMHLGNPCPKDCGIMSESFAYGITNGAHWYALYGGMQDWNYLHSNCFELTLELGCRKYPYESDLKGFWLQNKKSLIAFMSEVHKGVKGFVFDTNGKPVSNATVRVEGIAHDVRSAIDGDYWRLLIPGFYTITVFKLGFGSQTQSVVITDAMATQLNFTLEAGFGQWSQKYDFDNKLNLNADKYLNNKELHQTLETMANENKEIIKIFSNRAPNEQKVLQFLMLSDYENNIKDKPNVLLLGAIHGDQPVGRELLIRFVRHLIDGHKRRDPRVVHILRSLTLHIIPSVDDQGFHKSVAGRCNRSLDSDSDLEDKFSVDYTNRFGSIESIKKNFIVYKYLTALSIESNGLQMLFPLMATSADLDPTSISSMALKALSNAYMDNNPELKNSTHVCNTTTDQNQYPKQTHIQSNRKTLLDFGFSDHKTLILSARIHCCSYPLSYELPKLWKNNMESILSFLETSLTGINGYVLDPSNRVPKALSVMIDGFEEPVDIDSKTGKFNLVLNSGVYNIHISAPGFENKSLTVNVKTNENKKMNIIMDPMGVSMSYHNYDDMTALLANFSAQYPEITSLYSIGQSVQKRKIWVLRIGADSSKKGAEIANVRFIGGLNGNERATTELLLQLIDFLLSHYRKDTFVTQLIDTTLIYLAPMVNPDGAELAQIGKCDSTKGLTNANGVDLDQSFFDESVQSSTQTPETKAIKKWTKSEKFLVSITLRTGGNVITYPFSASDSPKRRPLSEIDKQSFEHLSMIYANAHKDMHLGSARCGHQNRNRLIKNGFTTGSIWHSRNGTLQDYGFNESNVYELYVYISCCGSPSENGLGELWRDHKTPVLELLNNVNNGIHGRVVDENGFGISNAKIKVESIAHKVYTTDLNGHYRIPLYEGRYVLTIEADGYWPSTKMANIYSGADNLFVIDMMSDTRIAGIPRAVFVIICGSAVLTVLIIALCVYNVLVQQKYQKKGFQRIGANGLSLFDDEEEDEEEELQKSASINGNNSQLMKVREYTDAPSSSEDELYNVHQWTQNRL